MLRPLLDGVVELHCKLKHLNLRILDLFIAAISLQVKADVAGVFILHKPSTFVSYCGQVSKSWVEQVVVIVAPGDFTWDHVLRVPVEKYVVHEGAVVTSEQISDVPVTMVVPLNLLI